MALTELFYSSAVSFDATARLRLSFEEAACYERRSAWSPGEWVPPATNCTNKHTRAPASETSTFGEDSHNRARALESERDKHRRKYLRHQLNRRCHTHLLPRNGSGPASSAHDDTISRHERVEGALCVCRFCCGPSVFFALCLPVAFDVFARAHNACRLQSGLCAAFASTRRLPPPARALAERVRPTSSTHCCRNSTDESSAAITQRQRQSTNNNNNNSRSETENERENEHANHPNPIAVRVPLACCGRLALWLTRARAASATARPRAPADAQRAGPLRGAALRECAAAHRLFEDGRRRAAPSVCQLTEALVVSRSVPLRNAAELTDWPRLCSQLRRVFFSVRVLQSGKRISERPSGGCARE